MKAIKNYTESQANELLSYLNTELGAVYIPASSIIKQYVFWYVPIVEGYEYLFPDDVLLRSTDINLSFFRLNGNPLTDNNFSLGVSITTNSIDIANNNLSTSVVDTEINSLISNFENFNTSEYVYLNIGGNNDLPEYANKTPSQSVIDSANVFSLNNKLKINYWDGTKNVSIPNTQIEIITSNDYTIKKVGVINRDDIYSEGFNDNENAFFVKKEVFKTFASLMKNERYAEDPFKCCVVFNDFLTIKEVFVKPDVNTKIQLNGDNLAYAPLDFFMKAVVLPTLGDPVFEVWNEFITTNDINTGKYFRVFPDIDFTKLDE